MLPRGARPRDRAVLRTRHRTPGGDGRSRARHPGVPPDHVRGVKTNPLVEQLFIGDDHERLTHLHSDEELAEQVDRELGYLVPYVEAWQAEGTIREGDAEAIAGTIEAAATLAPYREEIGEDRYPAIREVMIETIAAGLTTTDRGDDPSDPHEGATQLTDRVAKSLTSPIGPAAGTQRTVRRAP